MQTIEPRQYEGGLIDVRPRHVAGVRLGPRRQGPEARYALDRRCSGVPRIPPLGFTVNPESSCCIASTFVSLSALLRKPCPGHMSVASALPP